MTARCPAAGCRQRCRGGRDRCTDHELPATPDLITAAETTIHRVLGQVARGEIPADRAERALAVAMPLVRHDD